MTQKRKVQLFIACSFIMASFQACGPVGQPFGVPNSGQSAGTPSTGSGSGTGSAGTPQPGVSMPPTSGSSSNSSNSPGNTTTPPSSGSSNSGGTTTPNQGAPVTSSQSYMADPTVTGHTLEVCDTCAYTSMGDAADALVDGDTMNVHINSGDYTRGAVITKNNIIIHGVLDMNGNRPHLRDNVRNQKGLIVARGVNLLIENMELSGAKNPNDNDNSNYEAIQLDTQDDPAYTSTPAIPRNLKVRNCLIHDNDNGLHGNDNTVVSGVDNQVIVENSTFFNHGRHFDRPNFGDAHGLYIGIGVTNFVFRNSSTSNNTKPGHLLKTRALNNTIECSTIASLNGLDSYALDIPVGGTSTVRNTVIQHGGTNLSNSGNYFIRYGEEIPGGATANGGGYSLSVQNTYFVNDYANNAKLDILSGSATPSWSSNTFAGNGGSIDINTGNGAGSFTNYSSRSAAGLPAYNGTLASLPATPVCQ